MDNFDYSDLEFLSNFKYVFYVLFLYINLPPRRGTVKSSTVDGSSPTDASSVNKLPLQ